MASYREKLIQRKCETESGKIAYNLELLMRDKDKCVRLRNKNSVYLVDKYFVYVENLILHVYAAVEGKSNRYFEKVVWLYDGYDSMVKMLNAQTWHYI